MTGKYFEELNAGDEYLSPRRTVSEADIVLFTSITGLLNPLFTDEIFAREKGLGTRVAPGPLTLGYAIGLADDLIYGTVSAVLEINDVKFTAPVKPGDTIQVKTTVVKTVESSRKPDRGYGTLHQEVFNQAKEVVCTFDRTLIFLKRPAPTSSR